MSPGNQRAHETGSQSRLDSWKEIAAYLGKSVRCVQQWEAEYGLPVHRLNYDKKASVYAYKEALDAWRTERENLEVVAGPPVAIPEEQEIPGSDRPAPLPQLQAGRRRQIAKPMFIGVM